MRLLNPSPGELFDRLSILELKIRFGQKKGVDTSHFAAEKLSIEQALREWEQSLIEDMYGLGDEAWDAKQAEINQNRNALAAVNALLWEAEDSVRALSDEKVAELAYLAKQIAKWNDARSSHVHCLNTLYGADSGPEKLHSTS